MRPEHTNAEAHFVTKFLEFVRSKIDANAHEIDGISDKPDLGISSAGRIIGVELSQLPSSYIMRVINRQLPPARVSPGGLRGDLAIYPFEPHRWVHEVVRSKSAKASGYRAAIHADEIWLLLHNHSTIDAWPMSGPTRRQSRVAEDLLMRFGLRGQKHNFDRIFFIYSDGETVELTDGRAIPRSVSLAHGGGYPAVTTWRFSFGLKVPLPGLGTRVYDFPEIEFAKHLVAPKDDWMAARPAHYEHLNPTVSASVSGQEATVTILINDHPYTHSWSTSEWAGQTLYEHVLLQFGIPKSTFNWTV